VGQHGHYRDTGARLRAVRGEYHAASDEPIVSRYLLRRILFVSILIAAEVIVLFNHRLSAWEDIEAAGTVAVNILAAGELFYLFNTRFLESSSLSAKSFRGNSKAFLAVAVLILFQIGFTYLETANRLLGTKPLPAAEWGWILGAGLVVFLLVELEKSSSNV